MRPYLRSKLNCLAFSALLVGLTSSGTAIAHVALDSPNGDEQLAVGSSVTIHWHVAIAHQQLGWNLYYSTTGPDGPWMAIVEGLPVGDGSSGSAHTFPWAVPYDPSTEVRVRVVQDNFGIDYQDISADDLVIVDGPLFLDGFDSGGTLVWTATVD